MKKSICLAASLITLSLTPIFGQPTTAPNGVSAQLYQQRLQAIVQRAGSDKNPPPALTKFNLDFPGGTPKELVAAIKKAMGKPLNAIIPDEDADLQMPPLKMNDVVVPQLFTALEAASRKTIAYRNHNGIPIPNNYSIFTGDYGFQTADSPVSDSSIWYFHAEKPAVPPVAAPEKTCRFFPLAAYLNRGFTVDDITTAAQTGWKMSGETSMPELSFHKETKLLIAYGEPAKVNTIQNVLESLPYSPITKSELDAMQNHIAQLQKQVDQLRKQIPTPAPLPAGTLELKSGQ